MRDKAKQKLCYERYRLAHPDAQRLASAKWKRNHPGYVHPRGVAITQWVRDLKDNPCMDCNTKYPYVCMEWDHRDPSQKVLAVGTMVAHHYSKEKILAEISKCDLVCSNCHRIRTWGNV